MCGHVGVLSRQITKGHIGFFEQALFADQLRGDHGTGVAFFDKQFNVHSLKKAMGAIDFLDLNAYGAVANKSAFQSKFIMGHNRYATKGGISHKTSHPFQYGDIVMAHNGSLRVQSHLLNSRDFAVDSENIAYSLDEVGIEETIKNLEGSYSLVWANTKDKTVNFIRNKERPMTFGISKDKKTLLYASESLMLKWLAWRNGVELESIYSTEEDTLYTFDMGLPGHKDIKPKTKKIEGYKFVSQFPSTTNTHIQKRDNALKALGLKVGEEVHFNVTSFDSYKNTPLRGILNGYIDGEPYSDIAVYGFLNKVKFKKGDLVRGKIIGCRTPDKPPLDYVDVVILDANSIAEEPIWEDIEEWEDSKIVSLDFIYNGPGKDMLNYREFDRLTSNGCSSCSTNLFHVDHGIILWVDRQSPLCPICTKKYIDAKH